MKAITSISATMAAAVLAVLVTAGAVFAVAPTVGGTLSAAGNTITVLSSGNVPARVTLRATDVSLSKTEFDIMPGEAVELTFTGKAVGTVSATYTVIPMDGQEAGSATLVLGLKPAMPPAPAFDWTLPSMTVLAALGLLLLLRRTRPWRYRLTRV